VNARSHAQIARVAICAVVAAGTTLGCRDKPKDDVAVAVAPQTPVPAPEGLIAEATIATPDATWQRLQRGVGGAAGILPSTLGGIVCAASGIDAGLGSEIDGASAAYVVVAVNGTSPQASWVIAMKLVDARRTRALVEGETSRFDARVSGDFEVLTGKGDRPEAHPSRAVAAISNAAGWFVVARSEDDLARLAPYATRTMAVRPPPATPREAIAIDVPGFALAGPLRTEVAREWDDTKKQMLANDRDLRAQHGGRAPDFGDPGAIVAMVDGSMQARLAVLADVKSVHVGIDPGDDDLRAVVTATPGSVAGAASRAIAGIHPGDVAPLRAVTRDAGFALLVRDSADTRAKDAADLEAAIDGALGARLAPGDSKRIHGAIDDWTAARGDAWTLALAWGATDRGLVVDAQAGDPARASRAVHEVVDTVAHVPALREPLATWLGARDVVFGSADVPGGGRAQTAALAPMPPSSSAPHASAPAYTLAWRPGTNDVALALAEAPVPLLSPSLPGRTLGDDPAIGALIDALGEVSGALLLQPSRSPACEHEPGAVALAWGRRDVNGAASMWGEAIASDAALRCLAKAAF
jgi:hypothetical protein